MKSSQAMMSARRTTGTNHCRGRSYGRTDKETGRLAAPRFLFWSQSRREIRCRWSLRFGLLWGEERPPWMPRITGNNSGNGRTGGRRGIGEMTREAPSGQRYFQFGIPRNLGCESSVSASTRSSNKKLVIGEFEDWRNLWSGFVPSIAGLDARATVVRTEGPRIVTP
jgi:hypothetical protein